MSKQTKKNSESRFDSDESDMSIVVVSQSPFDSDKFEKNYNKSKLTNASSASSSIPSSTDSLDLDPSELVKKIGALTKELNDYKYQAAILNNECDSLRHKYENANAQATKSVKINKKYRFNEDAFKQDDGFIDVNSLVIAEKIEQHLKEANRLFTDSSKLKLCMEYLINNFWSLVAYLYTDENLADVKDLRDSLLSKLNKAITELKKTEMSESKDSMNTVLGQSMTMLQLNDLSKEMRACKEETDSFKEKILAQNQMLKEFIRQVEEKSIQDVKASSLEGLSTNLSITPTIQILERVDNEPVKANGLVYKVEEDVEEEEEDDEISPGSSPSEFSVNAMKAFLRNQQNKQNKYFIFYFY